MDELVGGENHHDGLWVARGDDADAECDGGGGIAFCGLCEDIFMREHGGDFPHGIDLEGVCEDEDVFDRDEALEAADGLGKEGACAEEIEELLGLVIAAKRPEAGAGAAGEDEGVGVFW